MLNDIAMSKDYAKKFNDKYKSNPLNPLVLTSGNWPALGDGDTTKLPPNMQELTQEFNFFYKNLDASYN